MDYNYINTLTKRLFLITISDYALIMLAKGKERENVFKSVLWDIKFSKLE